MHRGVFVVFALSILSASCASHHAGSKALIPEFKAMAVQQTEFGVSIGLEPFVQADRLREVFDENLAERGVLAVQVFVQNRHDKPIQVAPHLITLLLSDGTEITHMVPLPPPSYAIQRSKFCDDAAILGAGPAGVLINIGCGIFLEARKAKAEDDMARWKKYAGKEFKSATLGKEMWTHGFVFFQIPPEKHDSTDAMLLFRFTEADESGEVEQTVPLSRTGFRLK